MKKILLLLIVLVCIPTAFAQSGHMRLLAVSDTENGKRGGIADLLLEIKPGTGRVFLETFPLTRVDTQISTRFAKEIACDYAQVDCNQYDFFYTITADSAIIAGPSAGAAISVLTFSLITDTKLDRKVAITGTINSGGLIGPVGGIKEKVEAASNAGFKKVLVPFVEAMAGNETNESYDVDELEELYDVRVIQVPTFDDALFEFTGKHFKEQSSTLDVNENYQDTMKELAIQLCSRSTQLKQQVASINIDANHSQIIKDNAINLSERGRNSFDSNQFYAAASFCFGSNVDFNFLLLQDEDMTNKQVLQKIRQLRGDIKDFDEEMEKKQIQTITDLESYMVVKERLIEANEFLDRVTEAEIGSNASIRNLAYAMERIQSAHSWSEFLQNQGKKFDLNERVIKDACMKKIAEVEERLQYVQLYTQQNLDNTRRELKLAYDDLREQNYELCLFKASKAKASVDTILSVFGIRADKVDEVLTQKLDIVKRNLVEETEKGIFPVLGYSYFEYANSLQEADPFSALLYSGYALEMGDLDIYFSDGNKKTIPEQAFDFIDPGKILLLVIGVVIGVLVAQIPRRKKKPKKTKKKSKRK